ncbi:MAG: hypothetical protein ACFCUO_02145 [Rhodospirillales bacterium]
MIRHAFALALVLALSVLSLPSPLRADGEDDWEGAAAARSPACVQFGETREGDVVLVNPCAVCRQVAVERLDVVGRLSRWSATVGPKSSVDLPTIGAAAVRIIRDDPCR